MRSWSPSTPPGVRAGSAVALLLAVLALPLSAAPTDPAGAAEGSNRPRATDVSGGGGNSDYADYGGSSGRFDEYPDLLRYLAGDLFQSIFPTRSKQRHKHKTNRQSFIDVDDTECDCVTKLYDYLSPDIIKQFGKKSRRNESDFGSGANGNSVSSSVNRQHPLFSGAFLDSFSSREDSKEQMNFGTLPHNEVVVPKRTALLLDRLMTEMKQAINDDRSTGNGNGSDAGSKVSSLHYSIDPVNNSFSRAVRGRKRTGIWKTLSCAFNPKSCLFG